MKKLQLEQGSAEWHEFRKNHIGASDAPVIMNLSPWTTPYQLWRRMLDLDPPKTTNSAMQRGNDLEPLARMLVEESFGEEFEPVVCVSDNIEWMSASLDAISKNEKTVVEIKCPGKEDHLAAIGNVIPEKYVPQLQHQMSVCELDFMYYFSFDGKDGKLLKAYRDDDYINRMIEAETIFWECVQTLTAPPFGDKDFIERKDFQWLQGSKDWLETKNQLKELEEKEQKQRQYLIQLAENQSCKGNGITLTKIVRKGNIEYEKIPELMGLDLEKYRKNNIETWRIGVN